MRTVQERVENGRTDEDVDELPRVAAIADPSSVFLWYMLMLVACLMHIGVSCSRNRGHERNISPSWKPVLLCR